MKTGADLAPDGAPVPRAAAVQAMVSVGGVAALSWEVVWQIEASLALGASALGTAIVLAATMAGFTVGSLAMARWLRDRAVRPARVYGWLELSIGISGLLMPLGFVGLERLDTLLYSVSPESAPFVHAFSIALLLAPATCAMGATIPVFKLLGRVHRTPIAVLYGQNTAGACLGVILFSFVFLPTFGVAQTILLVAGLNVLVFASSRLLSERPVGRFADDARSQTSAPRMHRATASAIVFGTGFATLGLEVAWFRSLRAAFRATTDSFAIMLVSVLLPLALAAHLVPWTRRRGISPAFLLAVAAVAILLATPLVERMDLVLWTDVDYLVLLALRLLLSLAVLGPAMLFLGTALPWCLEEFPDPVESARLYALNTVGAVAGSLGAAWILLPTLGFARSAWGLGIAVCGLALLSSSGRRRLGIAVAGAGALGIAVNGTASLGRERVMGWWAGGAHRILDFDEGPDSTISVVETENRERVLLIDGFSATSEEKVAGYMRWMGRLPMLLHENPRTALVICFGTGQTADAVRKVGPARLDLVELNSAVFGMAEHFPKNHRVLDDPVVNAIVMDGRAWLRRSERRYDVITLEPMAPNFAGVNALYSREFYEIVARRLRRDGIATQWLPLHLLQPYHAASVVATFRDIFPGSMLWVDPPRSTRRPSEAAYGSTPRGSRALPGGASRSATTTSCSPTDCCATGIATSSPGSAIASTSSGTAICRSSPGSLAAIPPSSGRAALRGPAPRASAGAAEAQRPGGYSSRLC
jgi:predicted membrane-bound spermidine synthase